MTETPERIVAAAIMQGIAICHLPPPARHGDIIRALAMAGVPTPIIGEQGFITNKGEFVTRYEAVPIATVAGQIIAKTQPADKLFSEDLW